EPLVERLARLELRRRRGHGRREVGHRAAVVADARDVVDANDLDRDVVFRAALLRQLHQVLAGILRRHAVDAVADVGVRHQSMQASYTARFAALKIRERSWLSVVAGSASSKVLSAVSAASSLATSPLP